MIRIHLIPALAVTLALSMASAAAVDGDAEIHGALDIDADGSVAAVRLAPEVPEVVREAVTQRISAWRFEPVVISGVPVAVSTGLSLRISAREHADGLALEITDPRFGAVPVHAVPPRYPRHALELGAGASVEMRVLIGEGGEVVETHVHRTVVTAGRLSNVALTQLRVQFERAVSDAISQWHFDPTLVPAGATVPYVVELKVDNGPRVRGGLRETEFGDSGPAPWQQEDTAAGLWVQNMVLLTGVN